MKLNKRLFAFPMILGTLSAAFAIQGGIGTPAVPAVPTVSGPNGPSCFDRRDLEGGILLATTVRFLENVVRPADGAIVRPLLVAMNFTHGFVLMQDFSYLKLHELSDTTPIVFDVAGLDRNLVVPTRPPLPALNYSITLTPKAGFTWGTVRGAIDVEFVVVPN